MNISETTFRSFQQEMLDSFQKSNEKYERFRIEMLHGFQSLDNKLENKIDLVDRKLSNKIDILDNKIDSIDNKIDSLKEETSRMFLGVGEYIEEINYDRLLLNKRLTNLEQRFDNSSY